MTRVVWHDPTAKNYELGVDQGVLYVDGVGVPWNGLVSVDEGSSGGGAKGYYLDGVKYMNRSIADEYEATISAFYSPTEFDACDGSLALAPGISVTNQRRKQFGLTYRTKIGNALAGAHHAYKLHIVYNAMASPTNRSYGTIAEEVEPMLLRWGITTKPVHIPGMRRSSHLVVDSSIVPAAALKIVENILYGTADNMPRLPTPAEIAEIFTHPFDFTATANVDGTYTLSGPLDSIEMLDPARYKITRDTVVILDGQTAQISSD